MFNIVVRDMDKGGDIVANISAEKYLTLTQNNSQFTKSFSSNDFVEQLGLLEFAKESVKKDLNSANSASSVAALNSKMGQLGGGKLA